MGNNARKRKQAKTEKRTAAKASAKAKRQADIVQAELQRSISTTPRHRRLFQATKWAIGVAVAIAGLGASIDQMIGPFWPTSPYVYPAGVDPGSAFSLPFSVKNKSILFSIRGAEFGCLIDPMETKLGHFDNLDLTMARADAIAPSGVFNFGCGVSIPGNLVNSISMKIRVTYFFYFLGMKIRRVYVTDAFSWMRTTDGGRWIDGKTDGFMRYN